MEEVQTVVMDPLKDPKEIIKAIEYNKGDCNRYTCEDCPFYINRINNKKAYGCKLLLIGAKAAGAYLENN